MKQYAAKLSFGYPTMTTWVLLEAESFDKAYEMAHEETVEWASMFGFYQDPEQFGNYDEVGCDWDEDEQEFAQTGEIDPLVEEYNPEKHDGYLK